MLLKQESRRTGNEGGMSVDISKCEACTEDCPQAHARHEAATGRMYAMRELAKCAPYWDALFDENEKPKITPDRLRELVEADLEGRCEIHAAKDGDTVYSIFAYVNGLHIRKSNGEPITKVTSYVVDDFTRNTVDREFGKTVFPTSEAAEQALRGISKNGT